jgi:hypothetical protein
VRFHTERISVYHMLSRRTFSCMCRVQFSRARKCCKATMISSDHEVGMGVAPTLSLEVGSSERLKIPKTLWEAKWVRVGPTQSVLNHFTGSG